MESLELKILTPIEPGSLPEIQWNHEEAKAYILRKSQEYQNIAYTDADESDMKKDRAKINKFITAMENERKRVKAFYNEPYEKFNDQIKDVLQPMRDTVQLIDNGLREIDQQYRDKKTEQCRQLYERHVGDLASLLPFERTVKDEYFKKAFTPLKLERAYMDFFGRIREDMKALDSLPERFRDKAALEYMKAFSLSDALQEGRRLDELEKVMEERRQAQEREAAARTEQTIHHPENTPIPRDETLEESKQEETGKKGATEIPDPVMYLDFRVWGTKGQLMELRKYLIENGLKFGKVE